MNRIKNILDKPVTGQQLYLGTFVFYLFFSFLRNTTFNPYIGSKPFNLASYICVLLLVLKIYVYDKYKLKEYLLITFFLVIAVCSWRSSSSNLILVEKLLLSNPSSNANLSFYSLNKHELGLNTIHEMQDL